MSPAHVIKIAATAAVMTLLADVTAGILGSGDDSPTAALWVRSVLVTLALIGTVAIWTSRIPRRPSPGSTLFTGVLLGWALNPQSWIGRSYGGQLLADTGIQSAGADLILWAGVAGALAYVASAQLETARR